VVVALLVAAVVVVAVGVLFNRGMGPLPYPDGCTAQVAGLTVDLDTDQAENASVIAAVGVRRGLPARAVSIALATAFQESKLRNLNHGDRDSLGIFQQRPSQGWGTAQQITDPYYAANRFYDGLQKVPGYETMRITEAAQRVQHSGYPEAYADHALDARALASALTGYSPARFSCVVHTPPFSHVTQQQPGPDGLTARARAVRRDLEKAFGSQSVSGRGREVDVLLGPVTVESRRRGWAVASYLCAQAKRLQIERIVFDKRVWTTGTTSEKGWRTSPARPSADRVRVQVAAGG
jgi:hypothetical protein